MTFQKSEGEELARLMNVPNGEKVKPTFSDAEMNNRLAKLRSYMAANDIEAALLTSYHNINYFSDFVHCRFGRPYGLAVTQDKATTISALIDWGQPWRRANVCDNVVYTDWHKGNYWRAVQQLIGHVQGKVACEFDEITLDNLRNLQLAIPGREMVDIGGPTMGMRLYKSAEEVEHIKMCASIANIGGSAVIGAMKEGVGEHEVALKGTEAMVMEIAKRMPHGELRDTWVWFQSGINTDGAHNSVTTRPLQKGDICSLNAFPMVAGYYTALERTLFFDHASDEHLRVWQVNCDVHRRGMELIKPGIKCKDIAAELNDMFRQHGLLERRTFGYGHSFGVLCHYYGREAALEIREDVETVLEPGMVVSMEPMVTVPEGQPGAGGYREHDILVVSETGSENITQFPFGPEHHIIQG